MGETRTISSSCIDQLRAELRCDHWLTGVFVGSGQPDVDDADVVVEVEEVFVPVTKDDGMRVFSWTGVLSMSVSSASMKRKFPIYSASSGLITSKGA